MISGVVLIVFHLILTTTLPSVLGVLGTKNIFLNVVLYDNQNKEGPNLTMEIKACNNIPNEWNDKTSSIELYGRCIRLYRDQDCTGRMIRIYTQNQLWLNDLRRVNFDNMISSISSCRPESPRLDTGRYAIQSPWDRGVLTVRRLVGGYTMLKTLRWQKDLTQQWDVEKNDDETYLLTPRMFEHNTITYKIDPNQKYPTERVNWAIESLHNKMYTLKKYLTNLCLTMRPKMETQLRECRKEDKHQHWAFHQIRGSDED